MGWITGGSAVTLPFAPAGPRWRSRSSPLTTRFPNPTRRPFSRCRPMRTTLSVRPVPPPLRSTATSSIWQSLDRADAISNLDFHPDCACKVTKLLLILSCEGNVLGRMLVRKEQFPMLPNFCHTIHGAASSHKATEALRTILAKKPRRSKPCSTTSQGPPINPSTGEIIKMNHMQSNSQPMATASMFRRALKRFAYICAAGTLLLTATSSWAAGSNNAYHWTNLVSDIAGVALRVDSNLVNPWGLAASATNTLWVADNGTGVSTLYSTDGVPVPLVVTIPPSASNTDGANPTGTVFNSGSGFVVTRNGVSGPSIFIFVGEDGSISGWNPDVSPDHAILAVDDGDEGAVYKGATLASTAGGDRLYVTNFHAGTVDVYDQNFMEVGGGFVDPTLPDGYAPFGIRNINGFIYVTYAKQ